MDQSELHDLTVPELLHRGAERHPAALALSVRSRLGHRERLSYPQVAVRMESMAAALHDLGLHPEERVALFLSNDAVREGVLTALGCWRLGAAVAPLNPRASDDELAHGLQLLQPALVVVLAEDAERIVRLYPGARLLVPGGGVQNALTWPDPDDHLPVDGPASTPSAETLSCLLFTSGTTARAKAVMHCHRSQLHAGFAVGSAVGLRPGDIYQGAWPLFTSSVLNMACMSAWVSGCGVVLEEATLTNAARLRLIANERATVYHGVTSVLHFLVDEYARGGYRLPAIRRIAYGGAVMPPEVIAKFARHFPHADQVHIWGMTETGPAGTYLPPYFLPRKAGCIGGPMPACAVRVVDDNGAPMPPEEPGELAFSGPSMALGYFRNPEATAASFRDGWVLTGDVVRMDDEGHLHFVDRKKDIINRGGMKISSAAVEAALYRHPDVREAAVIAVPHPRLGEDVAACVVLRARARVGEDELARFCADSLGDYERPRRWLFLDELPKNPMGKILKRELRDRLGEGRATAEQRSNDGSTR